LPGEKYRAGNRGEKASSEEEKSRLRAALWLEGKFKKLRAGLSSRCFEKTIKHSIKGEEKFKKGRVAVWKTARKCRNPRNERKESARKTKGDFCYAKKARPARGGKTSG